MSKQNKTLLIGMVLGLLLGLGWHAWRTPQVVDAEVRLAVEREKGREAWEARLLKELRAIEAGEAAADAVRYGSD